MRKFELLAASALLLINCLPSFAITPDESLKRLREGNERYMTGQSAHPRIDAERRRKLADFGQEPIAAVLSCADARVPPESIFDQGFGDLFIVRVAGNVAGPLEMASLQYAVAALHVPVIVVLGHTKCGAVLAAIDGKPLPGSLPELMKMIQPAVETVAKTPDDKKDVALRTIEQNVLDNVEAVKNSAVISDAVKEGKVKVVGAVREIREGGVVWLDEAVKKTACAH